VLQQDPVSALREACGDDPTFTCRWVFERTDSRSWAELADIVFAKPLTIAVIVLVALVVRRLADRVIGRFERTLAGEHPPARRLKRRLRGTPLGARLPEGVLATGAYSVRSAARAATLGVVLRSLAGFVIWTIAAITVLGELGINLGPLVASAGIAGLALGFGAQSLVKDFLAGMFILIEDQYGVGDTIDAGELAGTPVAGTVEGVSLRTTRIRDADGTVWHVPNGQVLRVGNRSQQWQQALVEALVGPTADLERAQEVVKATAEAMRAEEAWARRIVAEPELLGVDLVTPEAITILVSVRALPDARHAVMRELRSRVKRALDAAGIPAPIVPGVPAAGAAKAAAKRASTR
jgi:moderate conductance mechanosensitive channel